MTPKEMILFLKADGLTQDEIAKASHLNQSTISRILKTGGNPNWDTVERLKTLVEKRQELSEG